jgi:predicted XRE-type DNA-binding protein
VSRIKSGENLAPLGPETAGLEHWLEKSRMTQAEAAKVLGVTQERVSDLKRGEIKRFSMDLLARLAARAGLKPKLKLAA